MGDTDNLILGWRTVMMAMVCLPVVICILLLLKKTVERQASCLLAACLFFSVITMVPQIIGFSGFYKVWPNLTFFPFSLEMWIGPLLYLHAYSLIVGRPFGKRKWLLLLSVVQTVYYCWAFFGFDGHESKWDYSNAFHSPYIVPVQGIIEVALLLFALISIWTLSKNIKQFFTKHILFQLNYYLPFCTGLSRTGY